MAEPNGESSVEGSLGSISTMEQEYPELKSAQIADGAATPKTGANRR